MGMYDDGPRVVIWEMTRACALACKHCRAEAVPRRDPRELTTAEAFKLVDDVAAGGRCIFVLTGGDPFMRPDLFEISAYAAGRNLAVAVSPSGTGRVTKTTLERLTASGCKSISLSVDGPDAQTHDAFRGVKGTFDRTVGAAALARAAGINLQVNTTIARHNHTRIKEMGALVQSMDAAVWTSFFLVPTGRAKREDCLDADAFEEAFADLFDVWKTSPFMVKTTEAPHFRRYVAQRLAGVPAADRPKNSEYYSAPAIGDGKGFLFVSHTGDVCPSGFLEIACGNVRRDNALEVYRKDPTFRRLRDVARTNGKCGVCDYGELCGGSRARAFAFGGDPFGPEPCCSYRSPAFVESVKTKRVESAAV